VVRNNYIHDNGGQGVIVSSAKDVAIVNNRIERNGLNHVSPWHQHGIYLSNWTGVSVSRVSVIGNVIKEHAGSGFQAWDPTAPTVDVLLQENTFENNTIDVILSNMRDVLLKSNTFIHVGGHPPTNAPRSAMLWVELSKNIVFEANSFRYTPTPAYGVPVKPIHYYQSDQKMQDVRWRRNTWDAPGTGLTDAALTVTAANTAPWKPIIAAEQSAANPVSISWAGGGGPEPTEYVVLVGTSPGTSDAGIIPMKKSNSLSGPLTVGPLYYVRLMARNAVGAAVSNEVQLKVASSAPAPVPPPTNVQAPNKNNTANFSWQFSGPTTGFTLFARYVVGGPIISSFPIAATARTLTVSNIFSGTYYISMVAHNGGVSSPESTTIVMKVNVK
jgi:hypothetical protein